MYLENNCREFEQKLKLVFSQIPYECIEHRLSEDVFVDGHCHFFRFGLQGIL
jgi:hypothetical protein